MAASESPKRFDPKVLAEVTLSTTLTTTLYTAPSSERGVKVTGIVMLVDGSTSRLVTIDHYNGATAKKLMNAGALAANGYAMNLLKRIGMDDGIILDTGDLIRGGQGTGTDVTVLIYGYEMED